MAPALSTGVSNPGAPMNRVRPSWLNASDANLSSIDAGLGTECVDHPSKPRGRTCGVHLHAVQDGVRYTGSEGSLTVRSIDSAVVSVGLNASVGLPTALPNPLAAPANASGGVHFPLVGNLWNTNYPKWYPFLAGDEASSFRFEVEVR